MKNIAIVVILALVGAGAAYGYLQWSAAHKAAPEQSTHGANAHSAPGAADQHVEADADASAVLCAKHRIPESIDAFCHPELVEKLGMCGEHGVPEAMCTQCKPVLIAAFKAENDWCAEHGMPESQCAKCKGG